jgi:hypothetical protein
VSGNDVAHRNLFTRQITTIYLLPVLANTSHPSPITDYLSLILLAIPITDHQTPQNGNCAHSE